MRATVNDDRGAQAPTKKIKNDILLIAVVMLVALFVGVFLQLTQKSGDTVRVSVNGELYGIYDLHVDAVVDIVTEAGYNCLVIRQGEAFLTSASCPDGICKAHRPISGTRESIVCLPNSVLITVERVRGDDAPDAVV